MWSVVFVYLFLQLFAVFGQNHTDFKHTEYNTAVNNLQMTTRDVTEELNELKMKKYGSFLNDMMVWISSAMEYVTEKTRMKAVTQTIQNGRRLKYKKAEIKFVMKMFWILKVILGLILPLGIIASKILSWKAVTISLMAFMLAKILFIKNLLAGKNAFSVTPTHFTSPLIIQGGPNDALWKRQGDAQNANPWVST